MADEEFPGREAVDLTPAILDADEDNFVWPDYAPPPPPTPPVAAVAAVAAVAPVAAVAAVVPAAVDPANVGRYLRYSSGTYVYSGAWASWSGCGAGAA
jgi:hypothetical protein